MPPDHETEGLEAARVIREELPEMGILVLSAHAEVDEAMELLAGGRGVGYVLKSRVTDVADFVETVERVAEGRLRGRPRPRAGAGGGPAPRRPARRAHSA